MNRVVSLTVAMLFCAFAAPDHPSAAEIKILSPGSTEGAFSELLPQFEHTSGHKITIEYGPVGVLAARVGKGEAVDVAILSEPATEDLRKRGKFVAGSEVVIAKVGIGAFVRKGDPHMLQHGKFCLAMGIKAELDGPGTFRGFLPGVDLRHGSASRLRRRIKHQSWNLVPCNQRRRELGQDWQS